MLCCNIKYIQVAMIESVHRSIFTATVTKHHIFKHAYVDLKGQKWIWASTEYVPLSAEKTTDEKVTSKHILLLQVLTENRLIKASHYYIPESSSLIGQRRPDSEAVDSQTEKALWQPLGQTLLQEPVCWTWQHPEYIPLCVHSSIS